MAYDHPDRRRSRNVPCRQLFRKAMIRRRLCCIVVLAGVAALLGVASASAAGPAVSVFPSPGTKSALPGTQITLRGIPAGSIGPIAVAGSVTGNHSGHIAADSDGDGGSFIPDHPFAPNETVTVATYLNVLGGQNGIFRFAIANPAGPINPGRITQVSAPPNSVKHFHSRPDLQPAAVKVIQNKSPNLGDLFVAPQFGPYQDGPELLDQTGSLIWFDPLPKGVLATDFRVQRYLGQPVLTWWEGALNNGSGRGMDIILNANYQTVAVVRAGNGLQGSDLHEFLLTPQGDAWIVAVSPLHWPGVKKPLMDAVVQEIDIKTGLVLFEWHAVDHVPLSESYFHPNSGGHVFDPFHINSVAIDRDGNPIVSLRNTWAAYKINTQTGAVIWTLGSSRSSFKMGSGTRTAFQHDVEVQPDGTLTMFDDGAGPPREHAQSRAIRIALNFKKMTVSLVAQDNHSPSLSSNYEGNAQTLQGGELFVGWGQQPYLSEFNSSGRLDFDARFIAPTNSYRAYRFPWQGEPVTPPAIAVSRGTNGVSTVYASWNGATNVSSWRVFAGPSASGPFGAVAGAHAHGFETGISVHSEAQFFAVQAVSSSGKVLSNSPASGTSGTRLSIFGHSAFVQGGAGGLSLGCFSATTCRASATITAGRTVIAKTGRESIGANSGGTIFFKLSSAGRSMLGRARGRQLGVHVSIVNADGARTSSGMNLIGYTTRGSGPQTSVTQSRGLQILSHSVFVSPSGVGSVFVACSSPSGCRPSVTLSSGRTVLARSGSEFVGGQDCGLVYFTLSRSARSMLSHARGNQLGATLSLSDGSNHPGAQVDVIPFS